MELMKNLQLKANEVTKLIAKGKWGSPEHMVLIDEIAEIEYEIWRS